MMAKKAICILLILMCISTTAIADDSKLVGVWVACDHWHATEMSQYDHTYMIYLFDTHLGLYCHLHADTLPYEGNKYIDYGVHSLDDKNDCFYFSWERKKNCVEITTLDGEHSLTFDYDGAYLSTPRFLLPSSGIMIFQKIPFVEY